MIKSDLKILQWNSQSIVPKVTVFEHLLLQEKIHFAAICETWLNSDININFKNYNIFRKDRIDSYGGVAILIHKSFQAQICQISYSNPYIELLCVKIYNCECVEFLVALYCPPNVNTTSSDWDNIFSIFNRKTIILGDFNGHHPNWSNKNNSRGTQIFDSLIDSNFVILNNGSSTRLKLVNGLLQQSAPDITLASSDISVQFDWRVTSECLGSDHLIIIMSYSNIYSPIYLKKRNFKRADWDKYRQILTEKFTDLAVPNNPQDAYNTFIETINNAADISIPFTKLCLNPNAKFIPKPYWTPSLSKSVAERRLALTNFRRNPTPDNLLLLKQKTRESQRLIRNAKNKSWMQFCDSLNESTSVNDMWRRMRWLKGYKQSNTYIDQEMAANLLTSLTPDFVQTNCPNFTSHNAKLESEFSPEEVNNCLKHKDTAPGCDEISYSMLSNLPDIGKNILVKIYNLFFFL